MEELVSDDESLNPLLHNDRASALVELNPSTPEHFVRN